VCTSSVDPPTGAAPCPVARTSICMPARAANLTAATTSASAVAATTAAGAELTATFHRVASSA
jgi:hypothetical protein